MVKSIFLTSPNKFIFINKKGKIVVGEKARTSSLTSPERGAYAVKRLIGLRLDSAEVQALASRVAYPILPAEDGKHPNHSVQDFCRRRFKGCLLERRRQDQRIHLGSRRLL